jgi:hypothetical protein
MTSGHHAADEQPLAGGGTGGAVRVGLVPSTAHLLRAGAA